VVIATMNMTSYREIPQELIKEAKGGKVELTMEDRRSEDYNPPKPKLVAFSGEGRTLGKYELLCSRVINVLIK